MGLKSVRISKGLTQAEAASIAGVSLESYKNHELGRSKIDSPLGRMIFKSISSYEKYSFDQGVLTIDEIKTAVSSVLEGYTGQSTDLAFTYGNIPDASAITVVAADDKVTVGNISAADNAGTVRITFNTAGDTSLSFRNSGEELATCSVSVTQSTATITGLPASDLIAVGDTLNKGRSAAAMAVNTAMVHTYWEIGRQIVEFEQKGNEKAANMVLLGTIIHLMGLEQGACVWHHQSLLILLKVNGYLSARVPARRARFPKGAAESGGVLFHRRGLLDE